MSGTDGVLWQPALADSSMFVASVVADGGTMTIFSDNCETVNSHLGFQMYLLSHTSLPPLSFKR